MRRVVICGLVAFGAIQPALGADYGGPVLRGSTAPSYYDGPPVQPRFVPGVLIRHRWDGLYVGAQVGYANSGVNFTEGVADLIANLLRNTTVQNEFDPSQWANLPAQAVTRASYGGFVGYNVQRGEIVFGVEANYNRTDVQMSSGDTIRRVVNTSDGYANDVTLSGTASIHLTDYGTLRARAGWVYEGFLPYGFIGAAVARATVSRSANILMVGSDANPGCVGPPNICLPPYAFADSRSEIKDAAFGYGWTLGAGVDWALFANIFLRAEYEYIGFAKFYGANLHINTVRAAVGLKF